MSSVAHNAGMYLSRHPPAPLDAVVECLWVSHRREASLDCEHMLPSGKAQLVIALHDKPIGWAPAADPLRWRTWTRGMVHGPQSGYYLAGAKPAGIVVGASFRPGAAEGILGVPMPGLLDRHVLLEDLWGLSALALRDRLAAADPATLLDVLEDELTQRVRQRPLLIHPAVAHALQSGHSGAGFGRVADAQRGSGYSPRHFMELFRSSVGLAPKYFYRVQRFSFALAKVAAKQLSLADVAALAGYSDQAHLSREFRELGGVTPSAYCPRSAEAVHHHLRATR